MLEQTNYSGLDSATTEQVGTKKNQVKIKEIKSQYTHC